MIKVLVFGITDNPGGVESVIMNYYRNFDKNKVQLDFLCNTEIVAYEDEIKKLGGTIYRVTARSKNRKKFYQDLDNFFSKHAKEYSTIWVNVCSLANIDYLKYAKKYGIKHRIIHSHSSQNMDSFARGLLHRLNKLILIKYATDFWSCSEESSKWFYNKKIINSDKFLLIHNAIDCRKFRYNEDVRRKYREELQIKEEYVVGNVGRLRFEKNQEFVIDVFNEYSKIDPDSILMLIGDGEDREKLQMKARKLKIDNRIMFMGVRNDTNNLYQVIDLFMFPSLFEGLSLSLLEAQASGVDCLISNTISSESIFSDNLTCLPLTESISAWVKELEKYKKSVIDRKSLSNKNCSKISKAGYSIEFEAKKLQDKLIKMEV